MNRRSFLIGLAATTAGCSAKGVLPPTSNEDHAKMDDYPDVTISDVTNPTNSGVDLGVEAEADFAPESPARLRLSVTNVGNEPIVYVDGPSPPFPPTVGTTEAGEQRLFLIPTDETGVATSGASLVPDEPTDGCWVATTPEFSTYSMARGKTLSPDESLGRSYVLLASPQNGSCLPAGEYIFESTPEINEEAHRLAFQIAVTE